MIFKLKITKKQRLFTILAGFITSLFFLIALLLVRVSSNELGTPDPFENLDNVMRDRFFADRNSSFTKIFDKYADKFFIIEIDEDSLSKIGRWPWDRRILAKMLERLGKAGAKVVGVDIIFTEPAVNPEEDIALLKAFAKHDSIILDLIHGFNPSGEMYVKMPFKNLITKMYPPEEQKKLFSRMGFVGIDPDSDGVVRETPLLVPLKEGGTYLYSLGLLMAAKYMNIPLNDIKPGLSDSTIKVGNTSAPVSTNKNLMTINYAIVIPPRTGTIFKLSKKKSKDTKFEEEPGNNEEDSTVSKPLFFSDTISFYEASQLDDATFTEAFKDKIVLIGATAYALEDVKESPLGVELPGSWIQANIAASILEGKFIKKSPTAINTLIIIAMGIISGLILSFVSPAPGIIFMFASAIAFFIGIRHQFMVNSILYPVATPELSLLFSFLATSIYQYRLQETEKKKIKNLFGGYLSTKVIDTLMDLDTKGKLGLAGKKEKVTIFYSDIRGFTSLSEKLQPEEVVEFLNDYFEKMSAIAIKYDAYIDKFIGDCMMAVFSAPIPRKDDAERAVKMAWEQQKEIDKIMEKYKSAGKPVFSVGMGINTGEVVLGNIGSRHKMDYTVIGDNVNLAARLYANAKGGQILISQSTYEEVKRILEVNKLEPIMVKGKEKPVDVYEITGMKE